MWNLLIEGFLLHYRNIIQFFSGNPRKHRDTDLSTFQPTIWAGRTLNQPEANSIQRPGRELEDEYWEDISQFLQHCTTRRSADLMSWHIGEMHARVRDVINAFARSVPRPAEEPRTVTESFRSHEGASTSTVSSHDLFANDLPIQKTNDQEQ